MIRELTETDAKNFFELNSDSEILKYTGDSPFTSFKQAETFLRNYPDYRLNGFGRWAVELKHTDKFIGWCGLKLNDENLVDLGFRFFKRYWGKGYATESAAASLDYGFNHLELEKIIGRAAKENIASIRVLEKIGMQFWKNQACNGIENSVYYQIDKSTFQKLSAQ